MPNLHKPFSVVFFVLFSVLTAQTTTSIMAGNWTLDGTWDNGVPNAGVHAVIAHYVTAPASDPIYMKNLTINLGATLDASDISTKIIVKGNWLNNGTFIKSGSGTVTFSSTVADQSVDPGSSTFPAMVLSNSGFSIRISDHINIDGNLTLSAGILDLNTDDKNVNIAGHVVITSGAVWTKGSGTVTFDGGEQNFTDNNGSTTNIGIIVVDTP